LVSSNISGIRAGANVDKKNPISEVGVVGNIPWSRESLAVIGRRG
jgi:hypothetical protein